MNKVAHEPPKASAVRSMAGLAYDLVWYLRHVRVIVVVLVAVVAGLRGAPQARDALVTLGQGASAAGWILLGLSVAWLGLTAWFWSRFVLGFRDPHDAEMHGYMSSARRLQRAHVRLWLPRVLGLIPFLGVSFALLGASDAIPKAMHGMIGSGGSGAGALRLAAAIYALAGIGFFRALILRRRWMRSARLLLIRRGLPASSTLAHALQVPLVPGERAPIKGWIGFLGDLLLGVTVAVSAAGLVMYGADPVWAGRWLQPGPTILFAAAALVCGGTMITWYGARSRIPILALLIVLAFGLAELRDADMIPDNHDVRVAPGPLPARPDIEASFKKFLAASEKRYPAPEPVPVILVATGGGGLAAAFWTATVLGDLADRAPGFTDQLFAISGVSGGSLGALTLMALLNREGRNAGCGGIQACAQGVLKADFLAPALGTLLYTDLLQRFVPIPAFADRATALELGWEARWRAVIGDDRLARPFLDLWPADHPWPALLLNGTSVASGGRLVTSSLRLASQDPATSINAADLLSLAGADVPASTAADNSARFPYIGPVGVVRGIAPAGQRAPVADLVADGGYFENFGATTLIDVLDALNVITRREGRAVRYIVLQIVSDPDLTRAAERLTGASIIPRGLSGPLLTLLRSRGARGAVATEALARRTAMLGGLYVPIRLGFSPTGTTAPLSWSLSDLARQVIEGQWTGSCRDHLMRAMSLTGVAPAPPGDFMAMLTNSPCAAAAPAQTGASPAETMQLK